MTNKILLAAIALGLWANAAVSYVRPARAAEEGAIVRALGGVEARLAYIGDEVRSIESHRFYQNMPAARP